QDGIRVDDQQAISRIPETGRRHVDGHLGRARSVPVDVETSKDVNVLNGIGAGRNASVSTDLETGVDRGVRGQIRRKTVRDVLEVDVPKVSGIGPEWRTTTGNGGAVGVYVRVKG